MTSSKHYSRSAREWVNWFLLHIEYQRYRQMHKPRANKALWRESRPDDIMMEKEALAARIQERTSVFCSR